MGAWGITAFESGTGLDAVGFIRHNMTEGGNLELHKIVSDMQNDYWTKASDVTHGESHTSPMALAEMVIKFVDRDIGELDYDEEWAADDNKFSALTSFTADRESLEWLRDYLSDTLKHCRTNSRLYASQGATGSESRGGWFAKKDWYKWQKHMTTLAERMDTLAASTDIQIELIQPQEQANDPGMKLE